MRVSALILLEKQAEVIYRKLPTTAAKKKSNLVFIKFFLLYLKRFFLSSQIFFISSHVNYIDSI